MTMTTYKWLEGLTDQQLIALRTQKDKETKYGKVINETREDHLDALCGIKDVDVPVQA
jgi:hypothetical protein